jgi:hypothetical protein
MCGKKLCDTRSSRVERLDAQAHPRLGREVGSQVVKSRLPTSTIMRKIDGVDCSQIHFFLGWWPLLFSQERWGHIQYTVYGSPAICYWKELVTSRILGHNQRPVVARVEDVDRYI